MGNHYDRDVDRERDDGALRREGRRREPRERMSEVMERRAWVGDGPGFRDVPDDFDPRDWPGYFEEADEGPGEDEDQGEDDGDQGEE